ncbi:GRC3 [Coprinopsis cinerea okayama7|uniref:Polynucleotide 5'-hydroxyl-kinase GRC3 n=1 Tax=Coprinopsis cinerea (strain Okayama-7 / 130 / ATCC MYA-4618 / FGSC 9003) TaxID=240176 RepID=A8PFR8_COPC7|nr:GRC3 [Coprinopsis cinerea okayama7\|eukprot:XP_001840996.2 GRC3 [Coprinopsis cinerea okayama7\
MISAVAARRAAAAAKSTSAEASSSASPAPEPQNRETSKPTSKRKSPSSDPASSSNKKAKTKSSSSTKPRSKPGSRRGSSKQNKPNSKRSRQPERYFSISDAQKTEGDSFGRQEDVIELDSSSEEDDEDDDLELDDDDGVTLIQPTRTRSAKDEEDAGSSSEEEEGGMDLDIIQMNRFSLLSRPPATAPPSEPSTLSTFRPVLDKNIFQISPEDFNLPSSSNSLATSLVVLSPHETLCLLGTCSLTVLHGSISILGTTIHSSPRKTHKIYSPSSSPLPVIRCSFEGKGRTSGLDNLPPRVRELLESDGEAEGVGAILVFQHLPSAVERLGVVCRSFEGVFEPSKWQKQMQEEGVGDLGIPGVHIVYRQTRDITPFVLPASWSDALDKALKNSHQSASSGDAPVYVVKGPRNTGKSTLARTLLNRLLGIYEKVAFLDCDLGQTEFTPPGMVSLSVVGNEVFGPPFTHLSVPYAAHFVGSTTPRSSPDFYLEAVEALLDKYKSEVERGSGSLDSDEEDDEAMDQDENNTSAPRKKIDHIVPLIVNTMGWTKGLGGDLTRRIEEVSHPSVVFSFEATGNPEDRESSDREGGVGAFGNANDFGGGSGMGMLVGPSQNGVQREVYHLQPPLNLEDDSGSRNRQSQRFTAADHRTLTLLSYFYGVFPETKSKFDTRISHWSISAPLLAIPPYEVDVSVALDRVVLAGAGYEDVVPSEIGRAVNGAVVALIRVGGPDGGNDERVTDKQGEGPPLGIPYIQGSAPPSPYTSTCVGLALHGSDNQTPLLQVLTPVPTSYLPAARTWVKGELEMPVWGLLDWRAWGSHSSADNGVVVDPSGKSQVPYLQWGRGDVSGTVIGGEKRRVRRNLMRRGQM